MFCRLHMYLESSVFGKMLFKKLIIISMLSDLNYLYRTNWTNQTNRYGLQQKYYYYVIKHISLHEYTEWSIKIESIDYILKVLWKKRKKKGEVGWYKLQFHEGSILENMKTKFLNGPIDWNFQLRNFLYPFLN